MNMWSERELLFGTLDVPDLSNLYLQIIYATVNAWMKFGPHHMLQQKHTHTYTPQYTHVTRISQGGSFFKILCEMNILNNKCFKMYMLPGLVNTIMESNAWFSL